MIAPGLLPVPATGGGAIETLMTSLAKENEEFDSAEMTVISPYEEKAHLDSSGYKNTRFIYISVRLAFLAKHSIRFHVQSIG